MVEILNLKSDFNNVFQVIFSIDRETETNTGFGCTLKNG